MKKIFLASILILLNITTVIADVTVNIEVTQTGPTDSATNVVKEKVGKDEQASYKLKGSYNGLPTMNAEEKVTDQSWTYTISSGSNVTCSPESGSSKSTTFTASSSHSGTYTITITMNVILTITKYKSDMQTVESTRQSDEYSKTTTVTLDVWGKLTISADEYLPINSTRWTVTVTADATLTGGTLTLVATDKLKLYASETGGTESNSLTLTLTNNTATCYVASGDSPSENASDQTLTATYNGTNIEETTKDLTVYKLTIEAPGKMVDIGNGGLVVPIMFNDDHDCGKEYTANWNCWEYCSVDAPGEDCPEDTHRELEPVWDYLYIGSYNNEDDLVKFKVEIKPTGISGEIEIIGSSNIRIWKNANKGDKNSIISDKTYSVSELPQTMYVEGIAIGSDSVSAKYIPPNNKTIGQTKELDFEVVTLIEKQEETRKIINENAKPINFTVKGGSSFNGKFVWNVPGYNNATSIGSNNSIQVSYGASGCNVTLPEDAAHRRFTTTVSVSIDSGKLTLSKTIRVAQATYQGTAVATTLTTRRTEVPTLAILPTMDTMPVNPPDHPNPPVLNSAADFDNKYGTDFTENGNAKIRYADNLTHYASTVTESSGINRKIYAVMLFKKAYCAGYKLEDLKSIAVHEVQHVNQFIGMRGNSQNWKILEQKIPFDKLTSLLEADAYTANLHSSSSWKFLDINLSYIKIEYDSAIEFYDSKITPATNFSIVNAPQNKTDTESLNAMKSILQNVYKEIPFIEMKNKNYKLFSRPPR